MHLIPPMGTPPAIPPQPLLARFGQRWRRHQHWLSPTASFLLAFGVRLWWVRHWVLPAYGDQPSLESFAANVAHGLYYGTHGAYWPPAFIFLAGFVERIFGSGHAYLSVRTADAVVGALTAAVTADLGRRVLRSPVAGLLAGLLLAVYIPAVYYTDTFLAVTLGTLMLVSVCDAVTAYGDAPSPRRLLLVGVLLGLATLTKPTELPLVLPAFVQWGLRAKRGFAWRFAAGAAAAAVAIALLCNVPWTLRNLQVTGSPVFVDVNGGINFFIAHNPGATGQFVNVGSRNPVLLRGSGYDRPNTNADALRAGMAYFAAHPGRDARQAVHVLHLFWGMRDPDISTYGAELYALIAQLHLPSLNFAPMRDMALVGAAFLLPLWRRTPILWLTAIGYSVGLSLLFFAPRYRLPVEPLLVITAAWAVVKVWAVLRAEWRTVPGPPAATAPPS